MEQQAKKKKSLLRRILKWTGITFLVLLILLIALPFIFKDKIIALAKEEAEKSLNAKLNFGDIDLSVFRSFPDVSVSVDSLSIANIAPFEGDTLISTRNFRADINLWSLFGDKYEINTIVLDHPRILARVLKDGKANWDITKPSAEETAPGGEASSFKMSLEEFRIDKGYIVYDDASLGMRTVLNELDHTLSGDFTEDIFDIETANTIREFTLEYGGVPYLSKVNTSIKAKINADMPNFKFTIQDNEIVLNELGLGVEGYFAMPKEDMDMDLKFKAKQTEFKNILSLIPGAYTQDFKSVKTSGKLTLDGFVKGIYNDKKMPAFGANVLIENAMFQYPSLPRSANDIHVDMKVSNPTGVPDNTVINIKKFHADLGGNPIDMVMNVATPVSDPDLNGEIRAQLNLGTLKDVLPIEKGDELNGKVTADVKMNGRMSAIESGNYEKFNAKGQVIVLDMKYKTKDLPPVDLSTMYLNFTPQYVELSKFESKIGRSDISAQGKIENMLQYVFKDQLLKGAFTMNSSVLDLNEFMTDSPEQPAGQPEQPAPEASIIEVPANIDFSLASTISKLLYDKMTMNDVKGLITIKESRVEMKELNMKMLGGNMSISNSYYDTKNPRVPKIAFNLGIENFNIPQTYSTFNTVQKLAPVAKYTQGAFSTTLKLASDLDSKMEPVLTTLAGEGDLFTKAVTVTGFEPLSKLADELKMDKFKKIDFNDLKIHYIFKDGKVSTNEFPFKSGSVGGVVKGSTGFDQSIDYKMTFEVPTADMPSGAKQYVNGLLSKANMLGTNMQMPEKVKLNALFGGTVTKPTVKTDVKEIAGNMVDNVKDQVKQQVDQKIDEVKQDVSKRVEEEKKKILDEAQKQADAVRSEAAKLAESVKKEGYKAADDMEKSAKNPLEKVGKKKLADETRKQTDQKAAKIVSDADKKANDIMTLARQKADAVK
jgi:hypothetical protein